jgi:thimet oligopeptidase
MQASSNSIREGTKIMKWVPPIGLVLSVVAIGPTTAAPLPADTGIAWNLTAAAITQSCKQRLDQARAKIASIDMRAASDSAPRLLVEIEGTAADMGDALAAQTLLSNVALTKDVRDASVHCTDDVTAFGVQVSADAAIYLIAQHAEAQSSTAAERRLAHLYVEAGRRTGAGLPPEQRAKVTALFDRLNKLQTAFGRALGEDRSAIKISTQEASSLPPPFVKTFKPVADGYEVHVNEATVTQFLKNEASVPARKRFYISYYNRGGQANVTRLAQAVALRNQIANMLGFKTWADYQLDATMAKTPANVFALLGKVQTALLPKARAEVAVLAEMKKTAGDNTPFARWDYGFYENELEKTKYQVDNEAVRQYFPVKKVIAGVFGIYEKLLGVHFDEIQPAIAWAPGVTEYSITDNASGAAIGWFFVDLYPRDGKYGHTAMFPIRAGRAIPGGVQRPVSAIIGNWPQGEPGKEALLSHDDVIVFFHEFGHLMHQSLSRAPYETLFGTSVRRDFVEAPSQMLENWMWQPSILKEISSNVQTGRPIPDELIQKMIAAKHVADGSVWSTQAFYASYDMRLHSAGAEVEPTALWFKLEKELTALPGVPGTIPEAGFEHLMGGYDAGYYGYIWSLVYAQDMFSVFEKGGLESPVVGMRYRRDILERGALVEPDVLLHDFLGRDVQYEPFYKYIGAAPP